MPIIQINYYICDICGKTEMRSLKTDPWRDPIVELIKGWSEFKTMEGNHLLHCPDCASKKGRDET